jgi:hypothetical protein
LNHKHKRHTTEIDIKINKKRRLCTKLESKHPLQKMSIHHSGGHGHKIMFTSFSKYGVLISFPKLKQYHLACWNEIELTSDEPDKESRHAVFRFNPFSGQ